MTKFWKNCKNKQKKTFLKTFTHFDMFNDKNREK